MNLSLTAAADRRRGATPGALAYAGALLLVAAATALGLMISPRWGATPVVLLYLPAVLAAAIYCGLWPALAAAVASTLAYDYYFTAPYHTVLVQNPADVVTLVGVLINLFLIKDWRLALLSLMVYPI